MMQGMVIDMEEVQLQTLAQVRAFLDGTSEMAFRVPKAERNQFIERVLSSTLTIHRMARPTRACCCAISGV